MRSFFPLEAFFVAPETDDHVVDLLPGLRLDQVHQVRVLAVRDQRVVVKAAEEAQHLRIVHAHDGLAKVKLLDLLDERQAQDAFGSDAFNIALELLRAASQIKMNPIGDSRVRVQNLVNVLIQRVLVLSQLLSPGEIQRQLTFGSFAHRLFLGF